METSKKLYRWLVLVGLVFSVVGAACAWEFYYSPEARQARSTVRSYKEYERSIEDYQAAQEKDVYGGKTPEETISLLVSALEKNDVDLAKEYFAIEEDPRSPDYMTRNAAARALLEAKTQGQLPVVIAALKAMRPAEHKTASAASVDYVVLDDKGMAKYNMTLVYNAESGVWKIQSL